MRYEAARRIEEEHDAKLEEREKLKQRRKLEQKHAKNCQNKSGEWKESDSGLEWIAIPWDPEEEIAAECNSDNNCDFDVIPNPDEEENIDFTEGECSGHRVVGL